MEGTLAARAIAFLAQRQGVPTRLYELRNALGTGGKIAEAVRSDEAVAAGVTVKKLAHRHTVVWIGQQTAEIPPFVEPPHKKSGKRKKYTRRAPAEVVVQNGGTLMGAVAGMLKQAGDKGMTMEEISLQVKKYLPQYKPTSASPAVSGLIYLGVARDVHSFGVRRMFFIRDYNYEKDSKKWNDHGTERRRKGVKPLATLAVNGSGGLVLIALEIGENKTEAVTIEKARQLYVALGQLFGE